MSRRGSALVLVSLLGHALFLGLGAPRPRVFVRTLEGHATAPIASVAANLEKTTIAQEARRALVASARVDRARNRLRLGKFLIEANRIDAEEAGQSFDVGDAAARYESRVADLRAALREEERLVLAVPRVFGDLRYYGQPGGRMVDALFEGGGSCEQIAHLVVAAAHDVGQADAVALRFYGKPMPDGATHLAPIGLEKGEEHDLMSGKPALLKGSRIAADELVEVYARAHDLAPPLAGKTGGASTTAGEPEKEKAPAAPQRPTLAAGFPPNEDVYPGSLPLYAAHAVQSPLDATLEPEDPTFFREQARHCAYSVRMAALSPPTIDVDREAVSGPEGLHVEPVRSPNPLKLEREAILLRAAEDLALDPAADLADKLMSFACLAALGDIASVDFTLAGEPRLAKASVEAKERGREAGKKALAEIQWSSDEGSRAARRLGVDYAGRTWLLLFLEGGGDVVLDLTQRATRDDWGRVSAMAALVLSPNTRGKALAAMEQWAIHDQVEVMHEVFHAHDHLRPWATNYDLERPLDGSPVTDRFVRAYRVFRGLAFRLWEGQRDVGEALSALAGEAREARLDPAWEAAMLDYYARNALGLYAQREGGFSIVHVLATAAKQNGHPSLDPLRRQIAYVEAEGRLDARTLADAFRLR